MAATRMGVVVIALGGVVVWGGAAIGAPFTLTQVAIPPDGTIAPSAGEFVTQFPGSENYFLNDGTTYGAVVGNTAPSYWDPNDLRPYVDDTTYLTLDPQGPGNFQGSAGGFAAPLYSNTLGGTGLDPGTDPNDGLGTAMLGGPAGLAWHPDSTADFAIDSEPTLIGGSMKDSLFIGQFVVDTPGATLVGDPLVITLAGGGPVTTASWGDALYLNGKRRTGQRGSGSPFQLNLVREPAGPHAPAGSERILVYLAPVPGPGVLGLGGVVGLWGLRRRRLRMSD